MGDKIISDTIANAGHVEDTREILYRLGINVLDKDGRYRSTDAIINDIHKILFSNNNRAKGFARRAKMMN